MDPSDDADEPLEIRDDEPLPEVSWDIRRQGRAWRGKESRARYDLAPEKIELIEGKLFWSERDRVVMLALLLENVGVDKAIRLGDPAVWREAIEQLTKPS
jgi:hypothetical protein